MRRDRSQGERILSAVLSAPAIRCTEKMVAVSGQPIRLFRLMADIIDLSK